MSGDATEPLTVGDVRREIDGLPDETPLYVMPLRGEDLAVYAVGASRLIRWDHDCTDGPASHHPGRDCPTVIGFEIAAQPIEEFDGFETDTAVAL